MSFGTTDTKQTVFIVDTRFSKIRIRSLTNLTLPIHPLHSLEDAGREGQDMFKPRFYRQLKVMKVMKLKSSFLLIRHT